MKPSASDTDLFRTTSLSLGGVEYQLRELSVKDNNACVIASKQTDGTFDGRIMMRMMVLKSVTEPKLIDTALDELPNRLYLRLCDVVSDLNADEADSDDEEIEPKNV